MASGVGLWWPLCLAAVVILQNAVVSPLPARRFSPLHSRDILQYGNVLKTPRTTSVLTRLGLHDIGSSHPDLVAKGNLQGVDADQYSGGSVEDSQNEDIVNHREDISASMAFTDGASPRPLIYRYDSLPELYWKLLRSSYRSLQWLTDITCRANRKVPEIMTLYGSMYPQLTVPHLYNQLRTLFQKLHVANASSAISAVVDTALSWIGPLRFLIIPRESFPTTADIGEFPQNGREEPEEFHQVTSNAASRRSKRNLLSLFRGLGENFVQKTRPFVLPALKKVCFVVGLVRDFENKTSLPLRDAITEILELFVLSGFGPIISFGHLIYPLAKTLLLLYTSSENQLTNSSTVDFRCHLSLPDFDSLCVDNLEISKGSVFVDVFSIFHRNHRTRRALVSTFEKFLKFNIGLGENFMSWLNSGIEKAKGINENWANKHPAFSVEWFLEDLHQVVDNLVAYEFPHPLNKIFQFLKVILDRVGPRRARREIDFYITENVGRGLYRSKRQVEQVSNDDLKYLSATKRSIMENTHRDSPTVENRIEGGQRYEADSVYRQLQRTERPEILLSDISGTRSLSNEGDKNNIAMRQLHYPWFISARPRNYTRLALRKMTDNFSTSKMPKINEVVISVMQRILEKISSMLGRIADVIRGISKSISVFPHSYVLKIWERVLEKVERFVQLLPTSEISFSRLEERGVRVRRKRMIVTVFNLIATVTADVTNALLTWAKSAVEKLEPYLKTLHNPFEEFSFSWLIAELRNLWRSFQMIDIPSPFEILMKMIKRFLNILTHVKSDSQDKNREKREIVKILPSSIYNRLNIPLQRKVTEFFPFIYSEKNRIFSPEGICTPVGQTREKQSFDYHSRTHLLTNNVNLVLGQIYAALQRILLALRETESAVLMMNKFWILSSENISPVTELQQFAKVIEVTRLASNNIVLNTLEEVAPVSRFNMTSTLEDTIHTSSELSQNTESTGFVVTETLEKDKLANAKFLIETPMEDVSQSQQANEVSVVPPIGQ